MDVNSTAASGVGQDQEPDTTNLPADHAPKYLAEAKRIYESSKPPFVTTPGHSGTEGSKRSVFVTKNGQRPPLPIRADLIARHWGPRTMDGIYWTLDLNGERFIVLSFPNRGCISGAKWVYCCWTGVGEEFEDRALAFSCINGEYNSTLGPRTESTAATTLTGMTASSLPNDHPRHFAPLPEDHPVEHLDEAKEHYTKVRPPFVILTTKNPRRRVLLAAQDGRFSAAATEAEVVFRRWDSSNDYATLDLDGKRFIVVGNAGGNPGGYQYHLWLGAKAGRVKKVVAYVGQHVNTKKTASGLAERLPEVDEDPSLSSSSNDDEDQDSQAGAAESQQYSYDDFKKGFDPSAGPTSMPKQFRTQQSIVSSEPSAREERPRRQPKPTKRARSPTRPAHFGSKKSKAPGHFSKLNPRRKRHDSNESSELSSPPYETPALTPSINDHTGPASKTQTPQTQVPVSLPTLTPYKQTHTTLRVTRDSNIIGFVPLRLLTCMTMPTLFSSVVAASGHREDEEPIKCLMAVFDWKDDSDIYKTIYIDKAIDGSFEIFLEIIDEASCWKDEGGKCGIAVEIVRA